MAGWFAVADAVVDDAAEHLEQLGDTMDLVEHDQAMPHRAEVAARVGKAVQVAGVFQVEVEAGFGCGGSGVAGRVGDGPRQRRLSDLPRTEEGDGREEREVLL